jgi:hypothetical protein
MKDLGPLYYFLGIQVERTAAGFFLSQERYAEDLLEHVGMNNYRPATTPVDTKSKTSISTGTLADDASYYCNIIGGLQYLTHTRPDLSYAIHQVFLHMHAPTNAHWTLVKRILRHIKGTTSHGLRITASPSLELIGYSGADWAGCPDT